ncbi:peptidoglycan DD-metalloendopeptidase family protein [Candidatus Woesearchaeota archaeon]|nr:peptidoglycan DD-metalloendopeptidase family protein [Candidatus Woesearchaeota archaeon]
MNKILKTLLYVGISLLAYFGVDSGESFSKDKKHKSKLEEVVKSEFRSPFGGYKKPDLHQCWQGSKQNEGAGKGRICPFDKYNANRSGGRKHQALDLYEKIGIPLYPTKPGKVVGAGEYELNESGNRVKFKNCINNGKAVKIKTSEGFIYTYIHLNEVKVKIGEEVDYKTIVGNLGITGNANAKNPHIHLQITYGGKLQDPEKHLSFLSTGNKSQQKENKLESILNGDKDAAILKGKQGIALSPKNLIYLTRLLYLESGSNDMDAIMQVIINRWKFDTCKYNLKNGKKVVKNITCKRQFGDGTLMSIVTGRNTHEFDAIEHKPKCFSGDSFKNDKGEYILPCGVMRSENGGEMSKLKQCYHAVLNALAGKSRDLTNGALYYKNPKLSTSKVPGEGAHAFDQVIPKHKIGRSKEKRIEYHYFMQKNIIIGDHVFYGLGVDKQEYIYDNVNKKIEYYRNSRIVDKPKAKPESWQKKIEYCDELIPECKAGEK